MIDRSAIWIAFCDMALVIVNVLIVAVNPPVPVKAGVDMKAEVLATAEWSVDIDADVDIHMLPPSHHPLFYGSRDVGCARLDADNRGNIDEIIPLADGTKTKLESSKETISIRCVEFGHYDLAVNEYNDHRMDKTPIRVHVEVIKLNPTIRVLFAKDIELVRIGQTINFESFDMTRDGNVTLVDPPLGSITGYQRSMYGAPEQ